MKAKVQELEDEVREGFSRRTRKELTGMVQGVSGKMRFLGRFQDGCDKDLTSNQLTVVTVDRSPATEEAEILMISAKHEEAVDLEKGYYHIVYALLRLKKEDGVDRKEDQADIEANVDKEEMEGKRLDDKRERHWRMVIEDNIEGIDNEKELLHAKRWDAYMNDKLSLIKGGYSAAVSGSDGKENHVVEEPKENDGIGLRGFVFFLGCRRGGGGGHG